MVFPAPGLQPTGSEDGCWLGSAITNGTADPRLAGTSDPAGGGAGFMRPDSAAEPIRAIPYGAIVEQMDAGVGILSADGVLLYANPRLGELIDRPCETLVGRPLAELIPPSQQACLDRLRQVSPGRTERAELELLPDAAGDAVRVLVAVSGLREAGIGTQCLIVTDLSGLQTSGMRPACDDQRYLFLAEAVSAFVVETDKQRRVCWVSPSVHAVLGWMPQDLLGSCLTDLLHPEEALEPEPPTGQRQRLLRLRARDGTHRWMRLLFWPLKGEGRIPCHWIISVQDVSELVAQQQAKAIAQARLATVFMRDSAAALPQQRLQQTAGLVSRSELLEQLSRQHPPAHSRRKPLALARCHLRNLREIHECQGSESAERVLRTIEERLRQVLRDDAILARVNVDQLLVVLAGMDNHAQAEATAESMRLVVGPPLPIPDAAIRITLGVDVTLEQPGERVEDLISSAVQQARVGGPGHPAPVTMT
jgi:PAS domain S-box-containing protein